VSDPVIQRPAGFTLLEVMIVIFLLGIILATAVPSINTALDEMKLDSAAQEVVSAIQYAQSLSVKEGIKYEVTFNLLLERMRCRDVSTSTIVFHPVTKKPFELLFTSTGQLQGVDIVSTTFTGNKVDFNSLGEPSESGAVYIGYAGLQKKITVDLPLGRVSVQ
jgi:prepilin-type N-terminal cleavage/methylation domain-containing protein